MSNLKRIHGSMNSLFSVSSTSSLKKKALFEKTHKGKPKNEPTIYKMLDDNFQPSFDCLDREGRLLSITLRLLISLKHNKDLAVKQELISAFKNHGSRFVSDLLGYFAQLDPYKLSKRSIDLKEACGKLTKLFAACFVQIPELEPPFLVTLSKSNNYFYVSTNSLHKFDSSDSSQQFHPSKRPRVEFTPKSHLRANTWGKRKRLLNSFLRISKATAKKSFTSSFEIDNYSTSDIIESLQRQSFGYYLVQPHDTQRNVNTIRNGFNLLVTRLLWLSSSKNKHRDFLLENEIKSTVEEHGLDHLQILLWHVVQLDDAKIAKEGFSVQYVTGSIVLCLVNQLLQESTKKENFYESEPEVKETPCYFRVPYLKRTCEADSTQRNAPVIPFET